MILSVIVTSYKFENYIEECIESILSQITNFEFEVLVRDDFSCDSTERILTEKYSTDPRIRIFKADRNIGAYENLKFLHNQAKGDYISFLDGDDYLTDPNKFQKQIDFLESNPDFVMHSTGYRLVDENSNFIPPCDTGNRWLYPLIPEVKTEDLLEKNVVGFGRVYRNFKNILKEEYSTLTYIDWVTNFELSFLGKIKCEEWPSGCYRISDSGSFSKQPQEKKELEMLRVSEILKELYRKREKEKMKKIISIIDCFVHDFTVEENLKKSIKKLKENGHHILLVSNTSIKKEILETVDYYFYDKRNQLFKKEYENVKNVDFWTNNGDFTVHDLKSGLQKHGLSVLINLFNSLSIAKNLGYTHFQRFETDDLYGESSLNFINDIPSLVRRENKKGIFYLNHNNSPADASFHYFFCEIDYFLEIMPRISCEEDYEKYLIDIQGNRNFRIVETYLYDHIIKNDGGRNLVLRNGGDEMKFNFPDTVWNTVVSASNLHSKYKGCVTDIYRVIGRDQELVGYSVYSTNYLDQNVTRSIIIKFEDLSTTSLNHNLSGKGSWCMNNLTARPISIDVYQDGDLLYSNTNEISNSYIQMN